MMKRNERIVGVLVILVLSSWLCRTGVAVTVGLIWKRDSHTMAREHET